LNGTRFLVCCRGHRVQTMLGVARVILVLVVLRHRHDPLPDHSIQARNLSRIVEASLFKMEHSQTQKRPGGGPDPQRTSTQSERFCTDAIPLAGQGCCSLRLQPWRNSNEEHHHHFGPARGLHRVEHDGIKRRRLRCRGVPGRLCWSTRCRSCSSSCRRAACERDPSLIVRRSISRCLKQAASTGPLMQAAQT
jgi:hypothetical protein